MPNVNCLALGCKSDSRKCNMLDKYPWMKDVTFHKFPESFSELQIWFSLIQRGGEDDRIKVHSIQKWHRLCSRHFVDGRPTRENPYPTVFVMNAPNTSKKRNRKRKASKALVASDDNGTMGPAVGSDMDIEQDPAPGGSSPGPDGPIANHGCQTDLTMGDIQDLASRDIKACSIRHSFQELLMASDQNVIFYTGFPSKARLTEIFGMVQKHARPIKTGTGSGIKTENETDQEFILSPWTEFLLTLVWMRQALPYKFLGDLFCVGTINVQEVVYAWVNAMHSFLAPIWLQWPSRQAVDDNMPAEFRDHFPRTRVLISCLELSVTPNLDVQDVKAPSSRIRRFLIGVAPNGSISFLSSAWADNYSDKFMVQKCGFLDCLEPGDHVMADHKFQIQDLLSRRGVELISPPQTSSLFKSGKNSYLKSVETTRKITTLMRLIDQTVDRMKEWQILCNLPNEVVWASELAGLVAVFCNLSETVEED